MGVGGGGENGFWMNCKRKNGGDEKHTGVFKKEIANDKMR